MFQTPSKTSPQHVIESSAQPPKHISTISKHLTCCLVELSHLCDRDFFYHRMNYTSFDIAIWAKDLAFRPHNWILRKMYFLWLDSKYLESKALNHEYFHATGAYWKQGGMPETSLRKTTEYFDFWRLPVHDRGEVCTVFDEESELQIQATRTKHMEKPNS